MNENMFKRIVNRNVLSPEERLKRRAETVKKYLRKNRKKMNEKRRVENLTAEQIENLRENRSTTQICNIRKRKRVENDTMDQIEHERERSRVRNLAVEQIERLKKRKRVEYLTPEQIENERKRKGEENITEEQLMRQRIRSLFYYYKRKSENPLAKDLVFPTFEPLKPKAESVSETHSDDTQRMDGKAVVQNLKNDSLESVKQEIEFKPVLCDRVEFGNKTDDADRKDAIQDLKNFQDDGDVLQVLKKDPPELVKQEIEVKSKSNVNVDLAKNGRPKVNKDISKTASKLVINDETGFKFGTEMDNEGDKDPVRDYDFSESVKEEIELKPMLCENETDNMNGQISSVASLNIKKEEEEFELDDPSISALSNPTLECGENYEHQDESVVKRDLSNDAQESAEHEIEFKSVVCVDTGLMFENETCGVDTEIVKEETITADEDFAIIADQTTPVVSDPLRGCVLKEIQTQVKINEMRAKLYTAMKMNTPINRTEPIQNQPNKPSASSALDRTESVRNQHYKCNKPSMDVKEPSAISSGLDVNKMFSSIRHKMLIEKPFHCDYCSEKFARKHDLNCHLFTHRVGIPFPNVKDSQVVLKKSYNDGSRSEDC